MSTAVRVVALGAVSSFMIVGAAYPAATVHFRNEGLRRPGGTTPPVTRLMVQFRSGTNEALREKIAADDGARLALRLGLIRALAVAPRNGTTLEELRARLLSSDRVTRVEDDSPIAIDKDANDPGVVKQYAIKQKNDHDIDAPGAWSNHTSCAKVAVLDTGVQTDHPDLKSNLWENTKDPKNGKDDDHNGVIDDRWGGDLVDGTGSAEDKNGHGTHVAGIIGARGNNDRGVSGLCWSLKIVAVRVLDSKGRGNTSQEIAGIDYAIKSGAKVINESFGGTSSSQLVRDAIQRAKSKGVLIVAAAGNDGKNDDKTPVYPAAYTDSNILSVAATNDKDQLSSFSNYGAKSVDMGAPGKDVASTYFHSEYAYMSGTSMATPYVAAAAAMLQKAHESWSISKISSRLRDKGDKLKALNGRTTSGRRLNIDKALG